MGGVLKSWAIPKGPSLNPEDRRLCIRVEDHPYDYKDFEGKIPAGNYGAGDVIIWDRGSYEGAHQEGEEMLLAMLRKGSISLILHGKKLVGGISLVRMRRPNQWLLVKKRDEFASSKDITRDDRSVISRRKLPDAIKTRRRAHSR
jgi:bifunctional non-homologous end joining protein LigD